MRQRPGQVARHQHIKALVREIRLFRIHQLEADDLTQHIRHMLGMLDHIRRQVNTGSLMSLGGQQTGKEARTGADIQNLELPALWQIAEEFREPALTLLAVIFTQSLRFKGLCPVRPVLGHAMFDHFHMLSLSVCHFGYCFLKQYAVCVIP